MAGVRPPSRSMTGRSPASSAHVDRRGFIAATAGTLLASSGFHLEGSTPGWRAGVATVDITPDRSLWMAGFAARRQPSQGVALPL
ncbi:MAG: hypothetical protein M3545_08100, partial [Acidobacteriota bacterium]|nr:hypothetical protein [Acidobacteriota bacterium]